MAGLDTLSEDTGAPAAAEPPAPIPMGATGASSAGGALAALDPYGQGADRVMSRYVDPNMAARAYTAGALTPGNFGASMRGALTELNQAKKDEADLKLRYIPIVEASIQARQQRQLAMQQAARQQDLALGNAALGSVAPFLNSQQPLSKQMIGQVLANAVQTGRTDMGHAQQLYGTLPDDPDELRRHLTGQVQAAVDPFGQHQTKLSAGQSLVNPLTGATTAQSKNYKVQEVQQGDKIALVAVNLSDPTDQKVLGSYAVGSSPDAQLQYKASMYGHQVTADNNAATIKKDYAVAGLNPDGSPTTDISAQVKAIGEYRQKPPTLSALRNPRMAALMDQVNKAYPSYDATQYDARQQAAKAYTAGGKEGTKIQAANTALNHLETVKALAVAEKNHDTKALNAIYNSISEQFGGAAPTNMKTAVAMVAPELVSAITAGGGGVGEREHMQTLFSPNAGPDQLLGAANQAQELLGGRLTETRRTYQRSTGRSDFEDQYLSPAAQAILKARDTASPSANATAKPTAIPSVKGFEYVGPASAPGAGQ
jgi:hypothetical protein